MTEHAIQTAEEQYRDHLRRVTTPTPSRIGDDPLQDAADAARANTLDPNHETCQGDHATKVVRRL